MIFNYQLRHRLFKIFPSRLFCILVLTNYSPSSLGQTWVNDTFADFIDGTFDAAGNNIYVSKDGKIRTIHRFDYNDDGYIDLLFPNTHDQIDNLPSTMAEIFSDRNVKETSLAYEGSVQVASADLNKNGYLDLVFTPNLSGIQSRRNFVAIIYGGEDGWPISRTTGRLPGNGISQVAIADFNRDGWPDIVTLNTEAWIVGQPPGNIIRIYWGGKRGYLNTRFHDIGVPGAVSITSGDFDGNGYDDIAVLANDSTITILWSSMLREGKVDIETSSLCFPAGSYGITIASGDVTNNNKTDLVVGTSRDFLYVIPSLDNRSWGAIQEINAFKASDISIGDIDSDGLNDVVLSYFEQRIGPAGEYGGAVDETSGREIQVLWGSEDGFSRKHSTRLEALYTSGTAIGDFDGDGNPDIAVAINREALDFNTKSLIYYGKGDRRFKKGKNGISTSGAIYAHTVRDRNGEKDRVIFCNSRGGTVGEVVPTFLYWGGPEGFSESNRTEIFMVSGYEATAADLNANGYTDLIILSAMHHGHTDDPWAGANIFWGGPDGIDFSKEGRTILFEYFVCSSNVADLNRNGYLDLVLGSFDWQDHVTSVIIYYGGPDGFTRENRVEIPSPGRSASIQLADYNKDGWLDIAVASYTKSVVRVFYGSEEGFDFNRREELDVPSVIDLKSADLNGNGWLDIVACSYNDVANNNHHDMGTFIFWGGPDGFNHARSQWLPGFTGLGPVVADFDGDGYLDIFVPHYHGELSRDYIPSFLYWGSREGFYINSRTALITHSAAQGFAADFNNNGKLDLAVANHTYRGNHNTNSVVFYNDGNRFGNPETKEIPTKGPHWSQNVDMGHIYDRSWRQTYESSIFEWNRDRRKGMIGYIADIPGETRLQFKIRSAIVEKELFTNEWIEVNEAGEFRVSPEDRVLQYKAVFVSDNGDRYPVLDRVTLNLIE